MSMWYRLKKTLRSQGERTENPKNCPFCGKKGIILISVLNDWEVTCSNNGECGLTGPGRGDSQGAIAAWNRIVVR